MSRARVVCAVTAAVLIVAAPAYAAPSSTPSAPAPSTAAAPSSTISVDPAAPLTVDPSRPSPSAPYPKGPPQGHAPDGTTIGGKRLDTRGRVVIAAVKPIPADVTVKGFLVADLDTGAVLAAQDPHGRYYPASTLKTLLITSVYDRLPLTGKVTVTTEDVAIEGSAAGLVAGGVYPVLTLWQAVLLQSDNQAANALARAAGGAPKTLALMNEHAQDLHAYDTVAGTPSGLDVAGQSSSPYDLCLFMRQIVDTPAIRKIATTRAATMPAVPPKYGAFQFQNQNKLLANYPGTIAGKTGFTDAARHTFVAAAARGKRRLVVSLMLGEQQPVQMWEQAAHLLDWAFAVPAANPGVGTLIEPGDYVPAPPTTTVASATPAVEAAPAAAPSAGTLRADHRTVPIWPLLGGAALVALAVVLFVRRRRGAHR